MKVLNSIFYTFTIMHLSNYFYTRFFKHLKSIDMGYDCRKFLSKFRWNVHLSCAGHHDVIGQGMTQHEMSELTKNVDLVDVIAKKNAALKIKFTPCP